MRNLRNQLICVLLLLASVSAFAAPFRPARASAAMVASVHPEASRAGVEIMKAGGNAVDASVAVGFALAVVHPQAGNLGGGGFLLVRFSDGREHFFDFREKAPAAATRDMYLDQQGNVDPLASRVGYRSIAVPGSVAGLVHAQKRFGKLTLAQVMAPAIRLAREGFVLTYEDAQSFRDEHLSKFPESRRIFQRNGRYYSQGDLFRQPELARTLERIAANPDDFYKGAIARELVAALRKGGSLITEADMASYEVKERAPIHGTYRGFQIISAPPPSSGGIALVEALNVLEGYDLRKYGNRSAQATHLIAEAFRRAFFDRAEFLGDPDFSSIPVAQLIDKRYGGSWRESLNPDKASESATIRRPSAFSGLELNASLRRAAAVGYESAETTHYSVVDAMGNAVAVTTTLNDSLGSRVTAEGLGFLLNDEMDDFAAKTGVPNMYGLIQGPANAVGPNKRPLSSMTPTIVLRPDGKLFLVLGSPGGSRIISTVANILIGVVDFGLDIQEAVNAPRFHHQWMPDTLFVERGFSPDTLKLLREMGHKVEPQGYWSDGECIAVDPKTGERLGASDARNNGKALGY